MVTNDNNASIQCYALYQSRNSSENVQTIRKNRIQIRNTALFFIAYTHNQTNRPTTVYQILIIIIIIIIRLTTHSSHSLGRILSAGGHRSVSVKRTTVQFSFERPFEMFQCTGGSNRSRKIHTDHPLSIRPPTV